MARDVRGLLVWLAVCALMLAGIAPARAAETVTVLDVFLAAGQSNMSGRGLPSGGNQDPVDPRIFQYGAKNRSFRAATVPLDMHDTALGLSPATTFAREYLKTQPANVGVLIIPAAHGGTGFTSAAATVGAAGTLTWTPGAASAPELDLPELAVQQTLEGIAAARAAGHEVRLKGVLWHQGENNATLTTAGYSAKLDSLFAFFRSRLAAPNLPIVVGRMSPEGIAEDPIRLNVDRSHHETPSRVPYTGFADSTPGGTNTGDSIHFSRIGIEYFGKTYLSGFEQAAAAVVDTGSLNAPVPEIKGAAAVGSILTVVPGAWGPAPVSLAYQWYRSGTAIVGATAAAYTLGAAELGRTITVKVTGSKTGYATTSKLSTATAATAKGSLRAPVPLIRGDALVGSTLTSVPGFWGPDPVSLAYQWYRSGTAISGATAATYTPGADDRGKAVTLTVTGSKPGYTTVSQTSTGKNISGALTGSVPSITGDATVGSTLTAVSGPWAPAPVTLAYQWYRSGAVIVGATAATYKIRSGDLGKTVTVKVTGSKTDYAKLSETSAGTAIVAAGTLTAPVPLINGVAAVGSTVTVMSGAWGPAPVTLAYQWYRSGTAIVGATAAAYTLGADELGRTITAKVTGSKPGFTTTSKFSTGTATTARGSLTAPVPVISGEAKAGSTLTAVPGIWGPDPVSLAYQWYRAGAAISGATAAAYTAGADDQGKAVTVKVTGSKTGYTTTSKTSTGSIISGALTAPVPSITGEAKVGSTLTALSDPWGPAPVTLGYQWYRSGTVIVGAAAATYKIRSGDLGKTVTVKVTGSRSGYSTTSKTSAGTATVAAGTLTASVPLITGDGTVGATLTAKSGAWGPEPVTLAYQWYRSGTAISSATAATYSTGAEDLGKTITVKVSGTKPGYTTTSKTSTARTINGALTAPVPSITGDAKVGSVLTAAPGAWGPAPVTLAYQWYRSGTAISGATAATYSLLPGDAGKTLTVKVTGSKTGYSTVSQTAAATAAVVEGTLTAPVPTITGKREVGSVLTAVPGAWGPAPVTLAYQWYRSGTAIDGGTAGTYTLLPEDTGKAITVKVTGSKTGYGMMSKTSADNATVADGPLTAPVPSITGDAKVGSTLTAVPGAWGPAPVTLAYQWYRSGTAISDAKAATYKVRSGDLGKTVTVKVTGSKTGYTTASKTSAGTAAVATGTLVAPVPTVTGTAAAGSTLTAVPGAWGPAPVTLAYQWYRSGLAVVGATAATYGLLPGDVGETITVKVTGSKTGYTTTAKTSTGTKVAG